jgi:hypothetical protein
MPTGKNGRWNTDPGICISRAKKKKKGKKNKGSTRGAKEEP